jgi:hypothetical protein
MIADAFFSFLNWLRLLFFNREMELALIGANCVGFLRGKVFVLYSLSLLLLLCLLQKPKTRAVRGALAGRSSLLRSLLNERARERGERSVLVTRAFSFGFQINFRIDFCFFLLCEFLKICTQN